MKPEFSLCYMYLAAYHLLLHVKLNLKHDVVKLCLKGTHFFCCNRCSKLIKKSFTKPPLTPPPPARSMRIAEYSLLWTRQKSSIDFIFCFFAIRIWRPTFSYYTWTLKSYTSIVAKKPCLVYKDQLMFCKEIITVSCKTHTNYINSCFRLNEGF